MANKKGQFKKGGGRIGDGRGKRKSSHRGSTHVARRRRSGFTLPLGLIAGLAPGVTRTLAFAQAQGPQAAANEALAIYSGYDAASGSFSVANMSQGLMPLLVGWALHRFVGSGLGINRALAAARVPVVRL